jgi:hypothetical protein
MSRYFFHVVDCEGEFRDENGRRFETPEAAAAHAAKIASELAQDENDYQEFAVSVTDEAGKELTRVRAIAKDIPKRPARPQLPWTRRLS